jgi:hypothetical protein
MVCRQWPQGRDRAFGLTCITRVHRADFHSERLPKSLDYAELTKPGGVGMISNDGDSRDPRSDLLEQLGPFPA